MHLCIPDGDEPAEWVDVRREERRIRRELRRLRYTSRLVDRRQCRGETRRRWKR